MYVGLVDSLGLAYDGSSLERKGLGGSESAVICIARELVKLGHYVTVFNRCDVDGATPGEYDGVEYVPLDHLSKFYYVIDVLISSRSVKPFNDHANNPTFIEALKILWLHDTFCEGDHLLEEMLADNRIDEVFTLSDWHTNYICNSNHGAQRHYEFMKTKIWQTRNGVNAYRDFIDVKKKDPNLFVYNASVTKGMIPLVKEIWPIFKERNPYAKLTVIGGYYRFPNGEPDAQELQWRELVAANPDIDFAGVITQREVSDILTRASYFVYPCDFPETYGISTLEAQIHNVTPITCRYGALEETALESTSWKIDGPVKQNWAYPYLDEAKQREAFLAIMQEAYDNKYLHYQKMYACNQLKDIAGWDSVAEQWDYHLKVVMSDYVYMSAEDHQAAALLNQRVSAVFGRNLSGMEKHWIRPNSKHEKRLVIVSPVRNAAQYIEECIDSVSEQMYENYVHIIVDDASTDGTYEIAKAHAEDKPHVEVWRRDESVGALANQMWVMESVWADVFILLDGDDRLVINPNILAKISDWYSDINLQMTYGSCRSDADDIDLIAEPYPPEVFANQSFRDYKFNWGIPYTHLRTISSSLIERIDYSDLKDSEGRYYREAGDSALFYACIEQCQPDEVFVCSDILVSYNDLNPNCDYRSNAEQQNKNAKEIAEMKKPTSEQPKRILIAIPTNAGIEPETFRSVYDLDVPHGYVTDFQYFYGYAIDQIRNLIADQTIKLGYDYLFAVDHDIVLPKDALVKLIGHDKDYVAGIYRQRFTEAVESYDNAYQRFTPPANSLVQVGATGFGCVLVKKEALERMEYPWFKYQSSLDFSGTLSEDVYFGITANQAGLILWQDTSVVCGHMSNGPVFPTFPILIKEPTELDRLRELMEQDLLPREHVEYLEGFFAIPNVVYDIGSCVMHWTSHAKRIWPDANIICFEAMSEVEPLYSEKGIPLVFGNVLGDENKEVGFYQNVRDPGGNSIYRENRELSPRAEELFPESSKIMKDMRTLDSLVAEYDLPKPNLIKMDVQGSELNVLKGAIDTLAYASELILELQHEDYNEGAPQYHEVIEWLANIGFDRHRKITTGDLNVDADYHFWRSGD